MKTTKTVLAIACLLAIIGMLFLSQLGATHPPYKEKAQKNNDKYPTKVSETEYGGIAGTIPLSDSIIHKAVGSSNITIIFDIKDVSATTPFAREVKGKILAQGEIPRTIDLAVLDNEGRKLGEENGVRISDTDNSFTISISQDWDGEIAKFGFHLGT